MVPKLGSARNTCAWTFTGVRGVQELEIKNSQSNERKRKSRAPSMRTEGTEALEVEGFFTSTSSFPSSLKFLRRSSGEGRPGRYRRCLRWRRDRSRRRLRRVSFRHRRQRRGRPSRKKSRHLRRHGQSPPNV